MKYPVGTTVRAVTQLGILRSGGLFQYSEYNFEVGDIGVVQESRFNLNAEDYPYYLYVKFRRISHRGVGGYLANCFERVKIEDTFEKDGIE